MLCPLVVFLVASSAFLSVEGVKHEDWRSCAQLSFCRRLRAIGSRQAAAPSETFHSPYSLGVSTLDKGTAAHEASWTWPVKSSLYPEIGFELRVDILAEGDGIARIRMDEIGSSTPFRRYNETAKWALLDASSLPGSGKLSSSKGKSVITYGPSAYLSLEITHSPLKIVQLRDGKPEIVFNDRSLFHMEHFRIKELEKIEEVKSEGEQIILKGGEMDRSWFEESDGDMYEERWSKWTDSKPKGPEGLSVDLTFPGKQHVYGLAEHASPLSLPDTLGSNSRYSEPYRLFNVDIFEYLADSSMALYGTVPLLHAQSKESSVGVLNLVGSDTWVDVLHEGNDVKTHWMSESGILDLLFLPGPKPAQLFEQYAILTGPTPLPPQWATAYHQCRWNYIDEDDVLDVDRRFDEVDIPLDVTWLDIEYADEHRYFDWDAKHFPDPVRMLNKVAAKGRKMVAIIDPHVKRTDSFRIYKDALELDILIKKADGTNFEGWCWTGSSVWVDYFDPKSWDWWTRMFSFTIWKESTPSLFIWNDMNEPSVFDGPEISVPKDTIHHGGWENRDVHNINGMMFQNQTYQALLARESPAKRPFVLSRSFFAGSQRYGAIWTGDNTGTWEHLAGQTAMLLSNNIAGMSFVGADVGGFFGNPSPEMLVRWYQSGAFMPFFRGHAHIDTRRREPYLFDEPIRGYLRDIIRLRYQLLPVWYNAFHDASLRGAPIIRPQYAVFPQDERGFGIDDQFYVGDSGLLVKPVTTEGAITTEVYVSDRQVRLLLHELPHGVSHADGIWGQPYFDYFTHRMYPVSSSHHITLDTPLSTFPLLIQGGSILPIRQRVRRASPLMWQDPFTLIVALSKEGTARGQLYLDDAVSYGYEKGEYIWRQITFSENVLRSTDMPVKSSTGLVPYTENNGWAQAIAHVRVEKVVVLGLGKEPGSVKVAAESASWTYEAGVAAKGKTEGTASRLTIKNPGVGVVSGWEIVIA